MTSHQATKDDKSTERNGRHVCDAVCKEAHIDAKRVIQKEELDEGESENHEREWLLHTKLYRDEWESFMDALDDEGCNSTEGEIRQEEWESKFHSVYCCDLRHIAPKCGRAWCE
jgi:hypothetical protein